MCRWVVYVGDKVLLADIIVRPRHSLVCQTHERYLPNCTTQWTMANMVSMIKRNAAVNADGFGVGWYDLEVNSEPCIFTSIAPAEHNVNLSRLCKIIQSHLIFGHVRAASLGSPVNDTNCHPFQYGRFLWMHNGCIANWCAVKRPMTALLSSCSFGYISGTTDSEVAGALFIDQLPDHNPHTEHTAQEIIEAMKRTVQIITQLVHSLHTPGSGMSTSSSLNFAVSDGNTVVATRFRDSPTEEPPSLYYCKVTHMEMVANEMEIHNDPKMPHKGVVIASEPLTYQSENWTLIPKNHMLVVTNKTDIQLIPMMTTAEIVTSKWISDAETLHHCKVPLTISDLNRFFGTPCCPCYDTPAAEPALTETSSGHLKSAPSSPHSRRVLSSDGKSAMILESPVMTSALRALLASATPSQLREILASNLLTSSSNPCGGNSQLKASATLTPAKGPCPGGSSTLDYETVANIISPSSSMSSLPPFSPVDFPFMHRGDSPDILQTDQFHVELRRSSSSHLPTKNGCGSGSASTTTSRSSLPRVEIPPLTSAKTLIPSLNSDASPETQPK